MNQSKRSKFTLGLVAAFILGGFTGCVIGKKQVVTTDPLTGVSTTNTVTVVDEANLALDCSVLTAGTSMAVAQFRNQPQVVNALTDAHIALDGIVHGANTQTTQDVIKMLKAQNNPALTAQVNNLVKTVSALEQKLILKYGSSVAGEIALDIAQAVDAGIVIGLPPIPAAGPSAQAPN